MATVVNMKGWSPLSQLGEALGQGLSAFGQTAARRKLKEDEDQRALENSLKLFSGQQDKLEQIKVGKESQLLRDIALVGPEFGVLEQSVIARDDTESLMQALIAPTNIIPPSGPVEEVPLRPISERKEAARGRLVTDKGFQATQKAKRAATLAERKQTATEEDLRLKRSLAERKFAAEQAKTIREQEGKIELDVDGKIILVTPQVDSGIKLDKVRISKENEIILIKQEELKLKKREAVITQTQEVNKKAMIPVLADAIFLSPATRHLFPSNDSRSSEDERLSMATFLIDTNRDLSDFLMYTAGKENVWIKKGTKPENLGDTDTISSVKKDGYLSKDLYILSQKSTIKDTKVNATVAKITEDRKLFFRRNKIDPSKYPEASTNFARLDRWRIWIDKGEIVKRSKDAFKLNDFGFKSWGKVHQARAIQFSTQLNDAMLDLKDELASNPNPGANWIPDVEQVYNELESNYTNAFRNSLEGTPAEIKTAIAAHQDKVKNKTYIKDALELFSGQATELLSNSPGDKQKQKEITRRPIRIPSVSALIGSIDKGLLKRGKTLNIADPEVAKVLDNARALYKDDPVKLMEFNLAINARLADTEPEANVGFLQGIAEGFNRRNPFQRQP